MTFDRLKIAALVTTASLAFTATALADDSTFTLVPSADQVVIQDDPDWQSIAWLLDEDRAQRVQDLLDELDFVAERLEAGTTPLAAEISSRVGAARAKVAGLWKVLGNPHDSTNDPASIFAETEGVVAFVDEFVSLTGVRDSADVERQWHYASRDFSDLRTRFGDS